MVVLIGGVFGKYLGFDEVMKVGHRISVLIKKRKNNRVLSLLCEDTARRQLSASSDEGPYQELHPGTLILDFSVTRTKT